MGGCCVREKDKQTEKTYCDAAAQYSPLMRKLKSNKSRTNGKVKSGSKKKAAAIPPASLAGSTSLSSDANSVGPRSTVPAVYPTNHAANTVSPATVSSFNNSEIYVSSVTFMPPNPHPKKHFEKECERMTTLAMSDISPEKNRSFVSRNELDKQLQSEDEAAIAQCLVSLPGSARQRFQSENVLDEKDSSDKKSEQSNPVVATTTTTATSALQTGSESIPKNHIMIVDRFPNDTAEAANQEDEELDDDDDYGDDEEEEDEDDGDDQNTNNFEGQEICSKEGDDEGEERVKRTKRRHNQSENGDREEEQLEESSTSLKTSIHAQLLSSLKLNQNFMKHARVSAPPTKRDIEFTGATCESQEEETSEKNINYNMYNARSSAFSKRGVQSLRGSRRNSPEKGQSNTDAWLAREEQMQLRKKMEETTQIDEEMKRIERKQILKKFNQGFIPTGLIYQQSQIAQNPSALLSSSSNFVPPSIGGTAAAAATGVTTGNVDINGIRHSTGGMGYRVLGAPGQSQYQHSTNKQQQQLLQGTRHTMHASMQQTPMTIEERDAPISLTIPDSIFQKVSQSRQINLLQQNEQVNPIGYQTQS